MKIYCPSQRVMSTAADAEHLNVPPIGGVAPFGLAVVGTGMNEERGLDTVQTAGERT